MTSYKLNPLIAGLAFAIFTGVTVLFMGVFGNFSDQYAVFVERLGGFYIGYSTSLTGILLGFLRAIVDGFCSAFLLVRIYNVFDRIFKK